MKFILNTAVDPHFCALFDEKDALIEKCSWTNRRLDGSEVFAFLKKYDVRVGTQTKLSFLGGVSGPGGFSSLRAGGVILNALSFALKLPVHQVRADVWIRAFLKSDNFLLNSFSDGVFFSGAETAPSRLQTRGAETFPRLQRMSIDDAAQKFSNRKMWVELLPEEKKSKFSLSLEKPFVHSEASLLKVLEASASKKEFTPDYEFPPV